MIKPTILQEINIDRLVSVLLLEIGTVFAVVLSEPDGGTWNFFRNDEKQEAIDLLQSTALTQKKERKQWKRLP